MHESYSTPNICMTEERPVKCRYDVDAGELQLKMSQSGEAADADRLRRTAGDNTNAAA